jgi:hypothetical protein
MSSGTQQYHAVLLCWLPPFLSLQEARELLAKVGELKQEDLGAALKVRGS